MGCSCQNQSSQAKPDPPSEPEFDELENAKAARALALLIYHGLATVPPESLLPAAWFLAAMFSRPALAVGFVLS